MRAMRNMEIPQIVDDLGIVARLAVDVNHGQIQLMAVAMAHASGMQSQRRMFRRSQGKGWGVMCQPTASSRLISSIASWSGST